MLEKAESQEWQAKLATLEAKLTCDYRKASEIASGMDLLKDALDWLATSKRVKQAQMARDVVQHTIEKNFPVMTINDYNEFSGELAQVLARVEQQGPMTSDTCGVYPSESERFENPRVCAATRSAQKGPDVTMALYKMLLTSSRTCAAISVVDAREQCGHL